MIKDKLRLLALSGIFVLSSCANAVILPDGTEVSQKTYRWMQTQATVISVMQALMACPEDDSLSEGGEIACEVRKASLAAVLPTILGQLNVKERDWIDILDLALTHTERIVGLHLRNKNSGSNAGRIVVKQSITNGRDMIVNGSASGGESVEGFVEGEGSTPSFATSPSTRTSDIEIMNALSAEDSGVLNLFSGDLMKNEADGATFNGKKGFFVPDCNGSPCVDDRDNVTGNGIQPSLID